MKKRRKHLPRIVKWADLICVERHRISDFVFVIRPIRSDSRKRSAQQQQNDNVPPSSPRHYSFRVTPTEWGFTIQSPSIINKKK